MASGVLSSDAPRVVELHQGQGVERTRAESYLEAEYARAFGGRIRNHYPMLMSVTGGDDQVLAAAGFRLASAGPLFLEQYLDEPVEAAIARRLDKPIARDGVVEIGNLASAGPCASRILFSALAAHLQLLGATHAVATATRQLRRSFQRIRFPVAYLAKAEAERLAHGAADWGAYYGRDPQVVVGPIGDAVPALRAGVIVAEAVAARLARRAGARFGGQPQAAP
ncbi:thermostable hemolysin [Phenylobacterium sp.]|uniref:thermostable hemolysin n=1 Tax=Phenylobacterium sp. TaxID=1871053 RepID=UPI0025E05C89|nr:thermostable hemolysin [Phenylobacterium sp.]